MATPDLSSVGTNSREGSYESAEDEDSCLYDPAHIEVQDDSFDESLEDTAKTPVVGPDDWRSEHGKFEGSPMPDCHPTIAAPDGAAPPNKRTDSTNSNGDQRPLPPLPGFAHARSNSTDSAPASPGLSATAERMLGGGSHRSLPVPPPASVTASDIQSFGNHKMTLEERLKLMMQSDDGDAKTAAEQQRERRMRRGAPGRERTGTPHSEAESEGPEPLEADDTIGDISGLDFQMPPRISRESIVRRMNSNTAVDGETGYPLSSPAASPERRIAGHQEASVLTLDPDVAIPSTEDSLVEEDVEQESSVIINRDARESEDDLLEYYQDGEEYSDREDSKLDDGSQYSEHHQDSAPPQHVDDKQQQSPSAQNHLGLDFANAAGLGLAIEDDPFTTKPNGNLENGDVTSHETRGHQRPTTPTRRMSKPEYDGTGWGESEDEFEDAPGSPGSVIHHPMPEDEVRREPVAVPERIATVKAPGAKLKTRLSSTPSDLAAMREARRQVSNDVPSIPPIPEKHRNRISRDMGAEQGATEDDHLARHPSFKNRSLTLDLDMGLSMDQDFERVIEGQKVRTDD